MKQNKTRSLYYLTKKDIQGSLAIIYITTIFTALLRTGLAISYQKSIDSLNTFDVKNILFWIIMGMFFIVVWNICIYTRNLVYTKASQKIVCNLRNNFLYKYINAPIKDTETITSGEVITKLTDDIYSVSIFYTYSLRQILFGIIQLISGLIFAFTASYYFGIVLIFASLICVSANKLFAPLIQKQFLLKQYEEEKLKTFSEDRLKHSAVTNIFNLYKIQIKKINRIISERTKKIIKLEKTAALFSAFSSFSGFFVIISLNIAGVALLYYNKITLGYFVGMFQISSVVLWPFQFFPDIFKEIIQQKAAMKRLNEFELFSTDSDELTNEEFEPLSITAKNISFFYNQESPVLKNFNYEAKIGVINCIAGKSGTGKSTFAKLLLTLYTPKSGEIYFTDKNNIKHKINKSTVSFVPQDCKLFTKTIKENISSAKPNADMYEIENAAKKAGADCFIKDRDCQYNTLIDNSTGIISYGQKQRISIARAILKNAKLIVFDEPSSALDEAHEKELIRLLQDLAKEKIIIVISHSKNIIEASKTVFLPEI